MPTPFFFSPEPEFPAIPSPPSSDR